MSELESKDDVAQGDPSDTDFVDHLQEAIQGLIDLGRPSRSADRSRIRADRGLPRPVFAYLAKKGLLLPSGGPADERQLTPAVVQIASDPEQLLAYLWEHVGTGRGGRRQPGAYITAIHRELQALAAARGLNVGTDGREHILASTYDWRAILWRPLQAEASDWISPGDRHRWLHHMRSSQSFALNLFGPIKLGMKWAVELWASHFPAVTSVEFEYPRQGDPLGEVRPPDRLTRTRADVRLDAPSGDAWLVEVKLTEPEFGPCSAGHDPENKLRPLSCEAPFQSLERLKANCYLHQIGRSYFPMLARPDSLVDAAKLARHGTRGCPLRQDLYQIVRNLLLVQALRATEGRRARFAVVAPSRDLNPSLHEAGDREPDLNLFLKSILKDTEQESVSVIDFSGVIKMAERRPEAEAHEWASYMHERYLLPLAAGRRAVSTKTS